MAVERKDNPVFNTIAATCEAYCNDLRPMRDELDAVYWQQHRALGETAFTSSAEQHEAMDRLGKLAAAIKAMDEAYSALNRGRCW